MRILRNLRYFAEIILLTFVMVTSASCLVVSLLGMPELSRLGGLVPMSRSTAICLLALATAVFLRHRKDCQL